MQTTDQATLRRDSADACHLIAHGGWVHCVRTEVATLAPAQWVGDGRTPEGQDEWPALLRELPAPV